ncbi:hypothetical protein MAR_022032, partial [Mya arenaria]
MWAHVSLSFSRAGKDSHGCKAAQASEQMITATDTSVYDAINSPGCNAAQHYEKLSKEIDTSDYDALNLVQTAPEKGDNGPDNSHVYTSLDESKSQPPMYYGNVKK